MTTSLAPPDTAVVLAGDDVTLLRSAQTLWNGIWERGDRDLVAWDLLRALAHAGNYVAVALRHGLPVGATLGFFGEADGRPVLHSHLTGVAFEARDTGVGTLLKRHQRAWAREHGAAEVRWTVDPLIARNAKLNVAKLGAVGVTYVEDFYGDLADAFNAGDPTDRLVMAWPCEPSVRATLHPAQATVLSVVDGLPLAHPVGDADIVSCAIPADIVALRRRDPVTASRWRLAVRTALGGALAAGFVIDGWSAEGYHLTRR